MLESVVHWFSVSSKTHSAWAESIQLLDTPPHSICVGNDHKVTSEHRGQRQIDWCELTLRLQHFQQTAAGNCVHCFLIVMSCARALHLKLPVYGRTEICTSRAYWFLPRCMECRRGLAMRFLSVCLSVRPSNAWIVAITNPPCSAVSLR